MLQKLADFDQTRENVKFFGKTSKQADEGACNAYVMQWLRAVDSLEKATQQNATERMEILRRSWHDIRTLEKAYTEGDYKNSVHSGASDFNDLTSKVGRTNMVADIHQKTGAQHGTAITEIPAAVDDKEFVNFYTLLATQSLKLMTFLFVGGQHALGVKGLGDTLLYFDPNDGEYLMDREGFFKALQIYGSRTGNEQLCNAWFIILL